MVLSPASQRLLALVVLAGLVIAVGATAWSWADAYADGQHEIADKRMQLQSLRELAVARSSFERLMRSANKGPLVLAADADPQGALTAAVNHAAEGQQVILDSVDPLPAEAALTSAMVRLRGTQQGLYTFLHAIEEQTPYLMVPRLEIDPFRAADPDRGKPLVLAATLRIAAITAPVVAPRPATTPSSKAEP